MKKTVSLCKTPLPYIALMHALPLFHPTHALPLFYPPHACPSLILSHPIHALSLFYPTPCTLSPYSIPPHACPLPILSQPMHALPLFYPTPFMPSPYSTPPHACPPPILSQPMHILPQFYPSPCMPSPNSIPTHVTPVFHSILFQPVHALLTPCHIHLEGMFLLWHLHMPLLNLLTLSISSHPLPCLAIWNITLSLYDIWMLVIFIHMNSPRELHITFTVKLHIYHIITAYMVYHYSSVDITHSST